MIETRELPAEYIVAVDGPLDSRAHSEFQVALSRALTSPAQTVSLDLERTTALASGPIGSMLTTRSDLKMQGRTFRIIACSDTVLATCGSSISIS